MTPEVIRVLAIEDSLGHYRLLELMLRESRAIDFKIENAQALSSGLEKLILGDFDVVLLDLGLPDSTGIDTLKRLHSWKTEVPIIVLTGQDDDELGFEAVKEGAQDFLVKGQLDGLLLIRSIRYAIERKQTERQICEYNMEMVSANRLLEEAIDELHRTREQVILNEKLASLGTLAAGLAHELYNPMMGIVNYIQFGMEEADKGSYLQEMLGKAEKETRRCTKLVKSMLTYSRQSKKSKARLVNCAEIVNLATDLLGSELTTHSIKLNNEVPEDEPVMTSSSGLQQVLINLLTNSIDALGERTDREITIRTENLEKEVRLDVIDNGPGIPPEIISKLFDPFFTTKEPGKGTGLGLSI